MNERFKLGEAKYFLARMEESLHDREAFLYNLSAFRTAGPVCNPICLGGIKVEGEATMV